MGTGVRILVVAPLHRMAAAVVAGAIPDALVTSAGTPAEASAVIRGRVRHDVALVDLLWAGPVHEHRFDGLDVLACLREADRHAPVLLTVQGHTAEREHLAEALDDDLVRGVYDKSVGPAVLAMAVERIARGDRLPPEGLSAICDRRAIHTYFSGRRGMTAGRLAAAIASGSVWDSRSLADLADVPINTANKVVSYLAPLIVERGEVPVDGRVTVGVVHRWCGEHAAYLASWARRRLGVTFPRP